MQGTNDQSRQLAIPAALEFMRDELGGRNAMAAYNTALCAAAAAILCGMWKTAPMLPPELSAPFMRTIETPLDYRCFLAGSGRTPTGALVSEEEGAKLAVADAGGVNARVATEIFSATGIQSQFMCWLHDGRLKMFCRISAQVYNTIDEYRRLGAAVLALAAQLALPPPPSSDRPW